MAMTDENRDLLFSIVRTSLALYGEDEVLHSISSANDGRPDNRIVTMANQHLFRQYRNMHGDPLELVEEAMRED